MNAKLRIVTSEEAEKCEFVVCLRDTPETKRVFDDDVDALCNDCGHAIFHRPQAPKKPPKICLQCARDRVTGGVA